MPKPGKSSTKKENAVRLERQLGTYELEKKIKLSLFAENMIVIQKTLENQ